MTYEVLVNGLNLAVHEKHMYIAGDRNTVHRGKRGTLCIGYKYNCR